ncbi:MAG: GtrA family protein [bacterium]
MIERLLKSPTDNLFIQFFRYIIAGAFSIVGDFYLLYILTAMFGWSYLTASPVAFLFGMTVNYVISVLWVFKSGKLSNRFAEFGIFALIGLLGMSLNQLCMWFFTDKLHFYYMISKIFALSVVYIVNFTIRKKILFN